MELSQLRYVVAVADTGNFTRAAARCNVAQPSLSHQIIQLEKEVGHKLFHRLGRKAVLTEAGAAFLERSRRILFEVENATKELGDHPSLGRRIVVGSIPTLAPYWLPPLVEIARKRFPNLQVDIREDFKTDLLQFVVGGELDLALVALPVQDPRIHVESLVREPLMLAVARDHPLASKDDVTGADLAEEKFVILGSSSSLAAQIESFCGDHHFEPKIAARCAQIATVKALVQLGVGISILPREAKAPGDAKGLAFITIADGSLSREIGVIRHLQRYQSRGAEQFLTLLREHAAELNNGK